jgi:hypothetical protein
LRSNARVQRVVYLDMNRGTTSSLHIRASGFFSDRYAYPAEPDCLSELIAFGSIVFIAVWPIILLANAMAVSVR